MGIHWSAACVAAGIFISTPLSSYPSHSHQSHSKKNKPSAALVPLPTNIPQWCDLLFYLSKPVIMTESEFDEY